MKSNDVHQKVKEWYFKDVSNKLSSQTSRVVDPIYNDKNAPIQIHTFGDSWTYGSGLEQEETFTHQLGELIKVGNEGENISVWNHGARGVGVDYIMKKVSEVYQEYDVDNSIYVITLPHTGRRLWFNDDGVAETKKAWELEHKDNNHWKGFLTGDITGNEYNQHFYFFHQYMLVSRLIGREKIIWGTWGEHEQAESDVPDNLVSVKFDCIDSVSPQDSHPGKESHKLYASKIANVLKTKGKWIN